MSKKKVMAELDTLVDVANAVVPSVLPGVGNITIPITHGLRSIIVSKIENEEKSQKTIEEKKYLYLAFEKYISVKYGDFDEEDKSISFDIIVDFKVKNREEVYQKIYDEVQKKYKEYKISITLDIDISD